MVKHIVFMAWKLIVVKISVLPNWSIDFEFNSKSQQNFLIDRQNSYNIYMERQKTKIAKIILKDKVIRVAVPNFKTYYKVTVFKVV